MLRLLIQAGLLGHQAQVKRLLLTHFWPEYPLEAVRAEAEEGFGQEVELAREGQTYEFKKGVGHIAC